MDGLEFLILINAVRFFKKGMELVIPSFYLFMCFVLESGFTYFLLILITIVSRQQEEERV